MPVRTSNTIQLRTQEYFNRMSSAAQGTKDRKSIYQFVEGVHDLGLWDYMICWPLRSSQNADTGNTAYSLGGLGIYDGTLINSPSWTADGLSFPQTGSAFGPFSDKRVTSSFFWQSSLHSALVIARPNDVVPTDGRFFGRSAEFSVDGFAGNPGDGVYRALYGTTFAFGNGQRVAGQFGIVGMGLGGNNWFAANSIYLQSGTAAVRPQTLGWVPVGGSDRSAVGTYAFSLVLDGIQITSTIYQAISDLYKQTLGPDLGLP